MSVTAGRRFVLRAPCLRWSADRTGRRADVGIQTVKRFELTCRGASEPFVDFGEVIRTT